jgi:hypothetical protein
MKSLIREIVLSRTFALSSAYDSINIGIDPENRWLWKANRRRLDPEALRDAMLMAAGKLDLAMMDSTVWYLQDQATAVGANSVRRRTDFPCRSVYLPVIRNDLPEIFEAFDFADPSVSTGRRNVSTVAPQALFMLNHPWVAQQSRAAAARLLADAPATDDAARVTRAYRLTLGRAATTAETAIATEFLRGAGDDAKARAAAWGELLHTLFASMDFRYVD